VIVDSFVRKYGDVTVIADVRGRHLRRGNDAALEGWGLVAGQASRAIHRGKFVRLAGRAHRSGADLSGADLRERSRLRSVAALEPTITRGVARRIRDPRPSHVRLGPA